MKQENKIITTYKGFDKDLKCRGFQYEVGKEYELPKGEIVEICRRGFHACESPLEVLDYYFMDDQANLLRFCEVEQSGEFSKEVDSTKVASSKIKIKKEITFSDLIKLGIEWLKVNNDFAEINSSNDYAKINFSRNYSDIISSGYSSQIGSSGDCTHIFSSNTFMKIGSSGLDNQICSVGKCARIASLGNSVQIISLGDCAQIGAFGKFAQINSLGSFARIKSLNDYVRISSIGSNSIIHSSGDFAKINSLGNFAQISSEGKNSIIMCTNSNSKVKASIGSWITLTELNKDGSKYVKTEYVDGERIKEDTWYKLFDGEFVEVNS